MFDWFNYGGVVGQFWEENVPTRKQPANGSRLFDLRAPINETKLNWITTNHWRSNKQLKELQHLYESDPMLRLLLAIRLSTDELLDEASELFNDACIITPIQTVGATNGQWSDLKAPGSTIVHPNCECDACRMLFIPRLQVQMYKVREFRFIWEML